MKTQSFRFTFFLLICFALSLTATAQVISIPEPAPPPPAVRTYFDLDPYYEQWVDVKGFPVLASAKVNPYALKEAAWLINKMIGHRPDILQAMTRNRARFSVIAHTEIITEIPEYRNEPRPDFLVYRERGWGGSEESTVTSSEENILHYPGVRRDSILIHEFAHGIHFLGLNDVDPTFDERLKRIYEAAMDQGLWQGTYASSDRREYWAESTHAWFYPNHTYSFNQFGNTRQDLKKYDPRVTTLLTEIYGDHPWQYTPIATRTHLQHFQGFDPRNSPTFVGFPELDAIYQQLHIPHRNGNGAWVNLPLIKPTQLQNLIETNVHGFATTAIVFVNLSRDDILLYGVRLNGAEEYWTKVPPGFIRSTPSRINKLWVVKDIRGKDLAVFQAKEKTGRALIQTDTDPSVPSVSLREVSVPDANLRAAIETVISEDGLMAYLTYLEAENAGITDLTGLEHAIHLRELHLWRNSVSDLSPLAGLTELEGVYLGGSSASNISPLAGLTNLESLYLDGNGISDLSPLTKLTKLRRLALNNNSISDLSPLVGLTNLRWMRLASNNISDLSPLVANTGLGNEDEVDVRGNPLNYASIYTHIPELQSRGVTVEFDTRKVQRLLKISGDNQQGTVGAMLTEPFVVEVRDRNGAVFAGVPVTFAVTVGGGTLSVTSTTTDENGRVQSTLMLGTNRGTNNVAVSAAGTKVQVIFNAISNPLTTEYLWSIPAGISLIHVPLKVTAVDGVDQPIESISDLYTALGGVTAVNFLMTYDPQVQEWRSYFGVSDRGTPADRALTDDTGIIAGMKTPVSIRLSGTALGTNGNSTITLNQGLNLVGIPLRDERINRVSDLLRLDGIGGNVPVVTLSDGGEFKVVGRASDPGDIAITGGGAFILNARQTATVAISGEAWTNVSETAAAPLVTPKSIEVGDATPVLGLRGSVVDEEAGLDTLGFRVTVKNLSTGRTVAGMTKDEGTGYQLTAVDIETARAATIGDILEISAQSPNPFIGVQSLRYTVTAEDVRQSWIQLPALVAYEIPAETELLANYPNPFNPETWIPYRLAEDAFVTLIIYDGSGRVVRTLDIGHRIASAYENRSKAIYWDGRDEVGESVASGVYFYHLSAGDYSATRKMLILK